MLRTAARRLIARVPRRSLSMIREPGVVGLTETDDSRQVRTLQNFDTLFILCHIRIPHSLALFHYAFLSRLLGTYRPVH